MEYRARKGQQLTLPLREVLAAGEHLAVEPRREVAEETVGADVAHRFRHRRVRDVGVVHREVGADGAAEQEHVLQHLPDGTAQGFHGKLRDVLPVDEDLPALNLVIADKEREDRRLTGARGTDEGARFPRRHHKGDTPQNPVVALIGEPHVAELNLPAHLTDVDGARQVAHLGRDVQQVEDALAGGECLLQAVELVGEVLNRVEEVREVEVERDDHTRRERERHAEEEGHGDGEHIQKGNKGAVDTERHDHTVAGAAEPLVLRTHLERFELLPVKDLNELHARQILAEEGIELRNTAALGAEEFRHMAAEEQGGHEHGDDEQQHDEREAPRNEQHDGVHPDDGQNVPEHIDEDVREEVGERRRIGGDARHERADRHFGKLPAGEALDMLENLQAEP